MDTVRCRTFSYVTRNPSAPMRCNENLPRSLGVPCNIRRAFPTVGTRRVALSGERSLCRQVSGFPGKHPNPGPRRDGRLERSPPPRGSSLYGRRSGAIQNFIGFVGFRAPITAPTSLVSSGAKTTIRDSKSCVFDQHSLFLQVIGDVVDQSGGPEMFNPRNCHALSLRIEFAAAGACLRSMRTAAGTAPSRFGMALSGVATPIHDPGGGPGG